MNSAYPGDTQIHEPDFVSFQPVLKAKPGIAAAPFKQSRIEDEPAHVQISRVAAKSQRQKPSSIQK